MNKNKKSCVNLKRVLPWLVGLVLGAGGGYLYYSFVGCASGACPISSNPYLSVIYGSVIGLLLGTTVSPGCKSCKVDSGKDL